MEYYGCYVTIEYMGIWVYSGYGYYEFYGENVVFLMGVAGVNGIT